MQINAILDIGVILLAAASGAALIKYVRLPTITSYILTGIVIGPSALNFVSPGLMESSDLITHIALSFIAFDLGRKFSLDKLRELGKNIFVITSLQVIFTLITVSLAVYLIMNRPLHISAVYGALACATDPATTMLVARQLKARGRFTDTLMGVVALDDGFGILVFALVFAVAGSITGTQENTAPLLSALAGSMREILGALLSGAVLGIILSFIPRLIKKSEDLSIYTLGIILFNTGLGIYWNLSVLMANMALGITVENISKVNVRFFDAVEKIESPFYVLFFVLAGAHLKIEMITGLSFMGLVYILSRITGKLAGSYAGAAAVREDPKTRKYMGPALMPQAGVALGFAIIAKSAFPSAGQEIFFVATASTVFFEIAGPVLTEFSLKAAGELPEN